MRGKIEPFRILDLQLCAVQSAGVTPIPTKPGVYAIVVDDEVRYVGAAQGGLDGRFKNYRSHTNKGKVAVRLRGYIGEALQSGAEVSVYATTPPNVLYRWHNLPIDGIAGLEEGLIREMRPVWNRRGLRSLLDDAEDEVLPALAIQWLS